MKYLFSILLFYVVPYIAIGQDIWIKGRVRNVDEKPIAYASIGVEYKGVGCISDSNGLFTLSIPDSLRSAKLTISHLGYRKYAQDIKTLVVQKSIDIILEDSSISIPEISIGPRTYKWIKSKGIRIPKATLELDSLGEEIGMIAKIKSAAFIEKIQFPVLKCTYDSVKVRINIYQIDEDLKANSLSVVYAHDVITRTSKKIDITIIPEVPPFVPEGNIAVTVEPIEIYGNGELLFPVYSAQSLYKKIVLGQFEKTPFNMGLNFLIGI